MPKSKQKTDRKPSQGRKIAPRAKSVPQLKKSLWELCKATVRARDKGICQACGATGLVGSNAQCSHLIASSICGAFLRYDLRNLYLCCFRCNISLSGNIATLYRNIEKQKGKAFMERLFEDKNKITKLDRQFLENKIAEYKALSASHV
jgi:hypothetical protein